MLARCPRRRILPAAAFHPLVEEGPGFAKPCPLFRPGALLLGVMGLQLVEGSPRVVEDKVGGVGAVVRVDATSMWDKKVGRTVII